MLNTISIIVFLLFILIGFLTIVSSEFKIKYNDFIQKNKSISIIIFVLFCLSSFYIIKTDVGSKPLFETDVINGTETINDSDIIEESEIINERINNLEFNFENIKSNQIKEIEDSIKNIKSTINSSLITLEEKDSLFKRIRIFEKNIKIKRNEIIRNNTLDCIIDRMYKVNGGGEFYFYENGTLRFYTPGWFGLPRKNQYGKWNYIGGNKIKINYEQGVHILNVDKGCYIKSEDFGF